MKDTNIIKSKVNNGIFRIRKAPNSIRLIWELSRNDFKKKYAGSYFGTLWALVQPMVTVLMYVVVFDKLMPARSAGVAGGIAVPYVVFLTSGLVPWFYFSEIITGGSGTFAEYSYLVKKILFKTSILPVIKAISATFVHLFFVLLLIIIASVYGYHPTIYTIQIIYYSVCVYVLTLGITYATSAIVVFFKDLQQIISIALQVGIWATPILWNIDILPRRYQGIINLNPIAYIVGGYRDSIYGQKWFFDNLSAMVIFWLITCVIFGCGILIFKRLKVHFADVI